MIVDDTYPYAVWDEYRPAHWRAGEIEIAAEEDGEELYFRAVSDKGGRWAIMVFNADRDYIGYWAERN
jgi:hypothetical protein